jgi:amidophosphoribosyltransferase
LVIKKNGTITETPVREQGERKSCSFERIYFSRGSDQDIYKERQMLGELLVPSVLEAIGSDIENTVFSYIPNTAEIAFYGMLKGMESQMLKSKRRKIRELGNNLNGKELDDILLLRPRIEKIAIKDVKLRTFIAQD